MKKRMILLLASLLILQSCALNNSTANEVISLDFSKIKISTDSSYINSTVNKIADLTPHKTSEEVNGYITAPIEYMDDENIYLIRNLPEDLPYDLDAYLGDQSNEKSRKNEIEVYSMSDIKHPPMRIGLDEFDGRSMHFSSISYNGADAVFSLVGYEIIDFNREFTPHLYKFDSNGKFIEKQDLLSTKQSTTSWLYSIIKDDFVIYTASKSQNGMVANDLKRHNLSGDEVSTIDESVVVFFEDKEFIYYIKKAQDESLTLYQYDIKSDEKTSITDMTADIEMLSAGYDEVNGIIYYCNFDDIYAYVISEKKSVKVMESTQAYMEISHISGTKMLLKVGHNQISFYDLPPQPESLIQNEQTLRICYVGGEPGNAAGIFAYQLKQMNFNGISVKLEDAYITQSFTEYMNTMAKKMLAGDSDYDLMIVESSMRDLFKEQYYFDLASVDVLEAKYDAMLPGIKNLCSFGDKICLYPIFLGFESMQYNNELIGVEVDEPKRFRDMPAFKDDVAASFIDSESKFVSEFSYRNIVQPWANQYAANFMVGNEMATKEVLREMISTSLNLMRGLSVYVSKEGYGDVSSYLNVVYNHGIMGAPADENISITTIPKIVDEFNYSASGSYIAVNPNSRNKQLAVEFIAYLHECRDMRGTVALYEDVVNNFDPEFNIVNPQLFELYKEQLKDSVREYANSEYMILMLEQFDELVAETVSIDEMTDTVYNFLRMNRDE
jgi:ABC-type sugar transport system, periplasmic component